MEKKTTQSTDNFLFVAPLHEIEHSFDGRIVKVKFRELSQAEDAELRNRATIKRTKGRRVEFDIDTEALRLGRMKLALSGDDTGIWVDGHKVDIKQKGLENLRIKIADWIYDHILDSLVVTEEEEKNL
jgi:hypothetical protein